MKLISFSKREKGIFCLTLGLIGVALAFNFFIIPVWQRFDRLNKEIEKKTFLWGRYSHLVTGGQDVRSLYQNYKAEFETKSGTEEVLADLFEKIQEITVRRKVAIKKISPKTSRPNIDYNEVMIEIEVEGNFISIFEFLNELEASSDLIKVFSLRLNFSSRSTRKLQCRLGISKIFFLDD